MRLITDWHKKLITKDIIFNQFITNYRLLKGIKAL